MENTSKTSFLGKTSTKIGLGLLLLLLIVLFLLKYCRKDDPGSITFSVPIKAPVAIALIDANRFLNTQVAKAKITLIDPDTMVVTSNGLSFSTLELTGGVMSLALKQNAVFSDTAPYRFTIKIEAEGYSSNSRNILVTSDEGQYVPIFMAKLDDPPPGMATTSGSAVLTAGVLTTGLSLTTTVSNGVPANTVKIDIPAGTQPIYCSRNDPRAPFPKNLNFRISYASPLALGAGRTFPGGPLVTDAVDGSGSTIATPASPIYFISAGWMNLEMDADGDQVNGFTKPVTVTMPIPDSMTNPLTGQLYKATDKIDVWSLNDRGAWRQESVATVEGGPGNLSAKMTVTHLSTWNLDCTTMPCATDLIVNYNNLGATRSFYSELIRRSDGIPYGLTGLGDNTNHILDYTAGSGAGHSFTIANAPATVQVDFVTYDNTTAPGTPPTTGVLASTGPFTISCGTPAPLLTVPTATHQEVKLSFDVVTGGTPRRLCKNAVWYTACATCDATNADDPGNCASVVTAYNFGGWLTSNGTTGTVTFHKTGASFESSVYCIRLWYAGLDAMGNSISEPIDIPVDFSVEPSINTPEQITGRRGGTDVPIERWYVSGAPGMPGTHYFRITGGVTIISTCPAS